MRIGLLLSLAFHAAMFFAFRSERPVGGASVAAGPRAGDSNAAAGSGALQAIAFAEVRSTEIPPPPTPLPSLDAPDVTIVETRAPSFATGELERPGSTAGRQAGFVPGLLVSRVLRPAPGGQPCLRSARQLRFADGGGAEPYPEE